MNYRVFCNYMNTIMNAIDAQDNHHETSAEKVFEIHGRWALARLEQLFHDHDQNIRRWLNGKPCVIQSDRAGNKVELSIGQDMEALYYAQGTHEAIISKEMFEATQNLRREREEKYLRTPTNEKAFLSGKIKCRECGWSFKKVVRKGESFWTCHRKGNDGITCKSHTYSDQMVYEAFIRMYNRFRQNEKVLLDETITQLQNLKAKITKGNAHVSEIDSEIAGLSEQNVVYSKLHTKGIIDDVSYFEKTDSIKRQIDDLRVRRSKLLSEDEDEHCIEKLRQVKRLLHDAPKSISEMDEKLFMSIVTQIYSEIRSCGTSEIRLWRVGDYTIEI